MLTNNVHKNLLLIDSSLHESQVIFTSVNEFTIPIIYSSCSTKTEILQQIEQHFTTIERIGLVFYGNVNLFLHDKPFFQEDETVYSENVKFIISFVKSFGIKNIDFLGCDTLSMQGWVNYYNIIEKETGVIVGASNDKTGNIKYGGDWIMETTSEDVELIYFTKSIEYYRYLFDFLSRFTLVIKNDDKVYGAGNNSGGQLGIGNTTDQSTLQPMIMPNGKTAKYTCCGFAYTIVLMTDGTLYGCGVNGQGQLGIGNTIDQTTLQPSVIPTGKTVVFISSGFTFFIALMSDGTVYGAGNNSDGQLGIGNNIDQTTLQPMIIPTGKTATNIICGTTHTVVLMNDNTVYVTGKNNRGQFGNNTFNTSYKLLTQMTIPSGETPEYIFCGAETTLVFMASKKVYGTGDNSMGQLGIGINSAGYYTVLTEMIIPSGYQVKNISCGTTHSMVLMTDGSIWGTGNNTAGQLGLSYNNNTIITTLQKITQMPVGKIPSNISCGNAHSMVLMTDGSIWGTGSNIQGQLGNGTTTSVNILTLMSGANDNKYISGMMITPTPTTPQYSNICFTENAYVKTDQGNIRICKINPDFHTINKKQIVDVSKSLSFDKYLICFKKNSLGKNTPNEDTIISKNHKIYHKGKMMKAKEFTEICKNVVKINYSGEIMYNVLMEEKSIMHVNNLICETLDPNCEFAKLYTRNCKYTHEFRDKLVLLKRRYQPKL